MAWLGTLVLEVLIGKIVKRLIAGDHGPPSSVHTPCWPEQLSQLCGHVGASKLFKVNKASEEFIFVASESAEMVAEVAIAGVSWALESTEVFIRHSPTQHGMRPTCISCWCHALIMHWR